MEDQNVLIDEKQRGEKKLGDTKTSRRNFFKLFGAAAATVAVPGLEIPEVEASGEEQEEADWPELPVYDEWGESRVKYYDSWFEVDDLAREWDRFPDKVNEAIYYNFGDSEVFDDGIDGDKVKGKQAELLEMYNEVRQKTGDWMRLYREKKHDFEMRRYPGLLKDLVGVGIVVEQGAVPDKEDGVLGLVRLLKKLDEDEQLGRDGRLERAREQLEETKNERTLAVEWSGSMAEVFGANEGVEEAWSEAGMAFTEEIERALPQGAVLFERMEFSKNMWEEGLTGQAMPSDDVLRVGILKSGRRFNGEWIHTGMHELKHLLEPKYSRLWSTAEGAITTDFGGVAEIMELMMEYDRTALEMMDLEMTSAELFHLLGEGETPIGLDKYETLAELVETRADELGVAVYGVAALRQKLEALDNEGTEAKKLKDLPEAHELIYWLVKNGLGDGLGGDRELSEEIEKEYGEFAEVVMRQVEHFLVNPAMNDLYWMDLEGFELSGETAKMKMLNLHNGLDAKCIEFMSGGEIAARDLMSGDKSLYLALVTRMESSYLGYDLGTRAWLFSERSNEPEKWVEEWWTRVEPFFESRDEFMKAWSGLALNSVPEEWLESELEFKRSDREGWESARMSLTTTNGYSGYFELLDREVVEEFKGENPEKWAMMVELKMDEWIYGESELEDQGGSSGSDIADYLLEEPIDSGE